MRERITSESIDKINKIEEEQVIQETKQRKHENLKRQINNFKNTMR